jgi:replicative DNA helicase
METNIEKRIVDYESNILKQAFRDKNTMTFLNSRIPEDFFQNQFRTVLWKSLKFIFENDEEISKSSLSDVFSSSGNEQHIEFVFNILDTTYDDELMWKYQFKFLYEIYAKNKILILANEIIKKLPEWSVAQIIDYFYEKLEQYDPREDVGVSMEESMNRAMIEIYARHEGRIIPFIKTGYPKFDSLVKLDFNKIVLIAAAKKIGKTKFIINLVMKILEMDPTIAVKFYSFELDDKEVVYEIIARDVSITVDEIQSKGITLTADDIIRIEESTKKFKKLTFDISTTPITIMKVKHEFKEFCKKQQSKRCILVIDNIGLLKDKMRSQTETDDYIARTILEIRDETKGLIFPIHHMTKEMEHEDRLKDAYRPRLEHLKGSTRIQDFANITILLHRPGFYPDLISRETLKGNVKLHDGPYSRGELIRKLLIVEVALNRSGDSKDFALIRFLHRIQWCQFMEWR